MRACGGVWVAQASGDADRETADARGRLRVPPDDPRFTLQAGLAHPGGGGGLLLRLLQRGPVAALPHRAHAPAVPAGGLGAVPRGQREVRGRGAGGDRGHRVADGPDPGLSLRAAARAHQARAPRRAHRDLLAHPVAELRGLLDLPVAGRAAAGHAGRRPHRLPHPVLLQQLPGHGGARDRGPHRLGALLGHPGPARDLGEAVPDQRGPGLRGQPARHVAPGPARRASTSTAEFLGVGVERLDYTKGLPERFRALGPLLRALPGVPRAPRVRAARRAQPEHHSALPGARGGGGRGGPGGQRRATRPSAGSRSSTSSATTSTATSGPSTATPTSAWSRRSTTA